MSSSRSPQKFYDITEAAIACALGGQIIRHEEEDGRLVFVIEVPTDLDLTDPQLKVPVPALSAWVSAIARQVKMFHQRQRGGSR